MKIAHVETYTFLADVVFNYLRRLIKGAQSQENMNWDPSLLKTFDLGSPHSTQVLTIGATKMHDVMEHSIGKIELSGVRTIYKKGTAKVGFWTLILTKPLVE